MSKRKKKKGNKISCFIFKKTQFDLIWQEKMTFNHITNTATGQLQTGDLSVYSCILTCLHFFLSLTFRLSDLVNPQFQPNCNILLTFVSLTGTFQLPQLRFSRFFPSLENIQLFQNMKHLSFCQFLACVTLAIELSLSNKTIINVQFPLNKRKIRVESAQLPLPVN